MCVDYGGAYIYLTQWGWVSKPNLTDRVAYFWTFAGTYTGNHIQTQPIQATQLSTDDKLIELRQVQQGRTWSMQCDGQWVK